MKNRFIIFMFLATFILFLALTSCTSPSGQQTTNENIAVNFDPEYVLLNRDEMINNADVILVGEVKNISPTQWNQDNGEYWEEVTDDGTTDEGEKLTTSFSAWPVHMVQLTVLQGIVDDIGIGDELMLTVLGKSPLDPPDIVVVDGVTLKARVPYTLQVGDKIIVFAVQGEIAWRDPNKPIMLVTNVEGTSYFDIGKRSIFDFISIPGNSYLVEGKDGLYYSAPDATMQEEPVLLEQFIQEISEKRQTLIQP